MTDVVVVTEYNTIIVTDNTVQDTVVTETETTYSILTEAERGPIGLTGPQGEQGLQGPQGEQGIQGLPGRDSAWYETSPSFTYSNGKVVRIDYESTNYKVFSYMGDVLDYIDYYYDASVVRKQFNYNLDGSLSFITETRL